METEQEQKTLRQIITGAFHSASPGWDVIYDSIVKALENAGYTRQPQTSPVGELSEADILRLAKRAHDEVFTASGFESEGRCERAIIDAVKLGAFSRPTAPTVYVTAERPPTEADANGDSFVLAYHKDVRAYGRETWEDVRDYPDLHPAWMRQPPAPVPPVSAEEAAVSAKVSEIKRLRNKYGVTSEALSETWDTAIAFCNREGASK